ncbi:uncharacterized protein LOC134840274 [Symsagittifera roscoffensis]|uniref:uncharacterized protein LOC134840274 n=1 Tax=Symsagittifera roscoffensis TaxID=84072 RepID=UPI00307BBF5D
MSLCGLHEWITGAFPDIIQKVPQDKVPAQTFDHVFIDMQHVIVNSSKSINNNEITNLFIPNHDVIDYCLHYIETIFTLFRPTKLFYIAMQGVEPQAAAIRTRKNAYLTAQRTSQLKVKLFAARMDSQIPPNVFDPNSVHAGSSFMLELQRNIEYWIVDKINSDSDWQNLDVFLSGHDVPGESKQKIGYSHEDAQLRARRDIYGFVYDLRPFPEDSNVALEFSNYRIGFYKYKLKFTEDHEVRKSGMGLLKTLCWIMDSTLSHVPSWDWAYPFDYGPMISDITGIANCSFRFPPDTPLTNFAYLMYVLPPESQNLLPEPLRPEITKEDRVEIDCVHFEDQKKFTILIPHRKIEPVEKFLESKLAEVSESDRLRNDRGVRKMYRSEEYEQEIFRSLLNSRHFPDICPCFVSVKIIPGEKLMVTDGQVMTSEHSFKEQHLEFQRSSTTEPEVTGVLPLRPNLLPPPPAVFMPQTDNRFVPRNFVPGGIRHVPPVDNSFDRKLSNSGPPRSMLAGYKGGFGHG